MTIDNKLINALANSHIAFENCDLRADQKKAPAAKLCQIYTCGGQHAISVESPEFCELEKCMLKARRNSDVNFEGNLLRELKTNRQLYERNASIAKKIEVTECSEDDELLDALIKLSENKILSKVETVAMYGQPIREAVDSTERALDNLLRVAQRLKLDQRVVTVKGKIFVGDSADEIYKSIMASQANTQTELNREEQAKTPFIFIDPLTKEPSILNLSITHSEVDELLLNLDKKCKSRAHELTQKDHLFTPADLPDHPVSVTS